MRDGEVYFPFEWWNEGHNKAGANKQYSRMYDYIKWRTGSSLVHWKFAREDMVAKWIDSTQEYDLL